MSRGPLLALIVSAVLLFVSSVESLQDLLNETEDSIDVVAKVSLVTFTREPRPAREAKDNASRRNTSKLNDETKGPIDDDDVDEGDDQQGVQGVDNHRRRQRAAAGDDLLVLVCPEVPDPVTGYMGPDPSCSAPPEPLARGSEAIKAFMQETGVSPGDTVKATFDLPSGENKGGKRAGRPSRKLEQTAGDDDNGAKPKMPKIRKGSIQILARQIEKEVYTGTKINLSLLVLLPDYCGYKNRFRSPEEYRKFIFAGADGAAVENNLQNYYAQCSFGKVTLDPANMAIVGPYEVPCAGNYTLGVLKRPYNLTNEFRADGYLEIVERGRQAAQKLAEVDTIVASALRQRNLRYMSILPDGSPKFGGLGFAFVPGKISFITAEAADDVRVLYHEHQHNLAIIHAQLNYDEYGDASDVQGNSKGCTRYGLQCHNAGFSWRLGWAGPVPGGDLKASSFTPSSNRIRFTLPAAGTNDKNMVVVDLGQKPSLPPVEPYRLPSPPPKYFFQYRVRNATYGGYDSGLPLKFHQKVVATQYDGKADDSYTNIYGFSTIGRGQSGPSGTLTLPFLPVDQATGLGGGLRVKVISVNGNTSAVVEVCRMYSEIEGTPGSSECAANLDRDCDGLFGMKDPDCIQTVQKSASIAAPVSTSPPLPSPPPPQPPSLPPPPPPTQPRARPPPPSRKKN